MKNVWKEVRAATLGSSVVLRAYPLALLAPLFCSSAICRMFSFGFHQFFGRKHVAIELLLFAVLCFPLETLAEAVVARMLFVFREGRRPSFAQVGEIVRAPGLVSLIFRLSGLVLLWMTVGLLLAAGLFVFGFVVKAFAFGMAHHGGKMPPPHGWAFAYLMSSMVIAGVLLSRYSFVLPLFALDCRASRSSFNTWVTMAKAGLMPLRLLNAFEYGLMLGIGHLLRPFEKDGSVRAVLVVALSLLVTAGITTWMELIKAEFAFVVQESALEASGSAVAVG